jgi:hypothetical protein
MGEQIEAHLALALLTQGQVELAERLMGNGVPTEFGAGHTVSAPVTADLAAAADDPPPADHPSSDAVVCPVARYWKRETKRRCQGVSTARGA